MTQMVFLETLEVVWAIYCEMRAVAVEDAASSCYLD